MNWDILIVNCEHGDLIASVLQTAGYRAHHAQSVEKAWEELLRAPVGLVVTDYMLPTMDGGALISMMRTTRALAKIPVIMVTPLQQEVVADKCEFDAFLRKPFTEAQLMGTVRRFLETSTNIT